MKDAVLVLANGRVFKGHGFGAEGTAKGEVVFTTGMTGYIETLTDPSYFGQIVNQTFPLIGNYGFIEADKESLSPHLSAYIVRNLCSTPSNFRCDKTLEEYLAAHGVVGLCDIDTRALTKILRSNGVMNGVVINGAGAKELLEGDKSAILNELKNLKTADAVKNVTLSAVGDSPTNNQNNQNNQKKKVILWDFGAKGNIKKCLLSRGLDVENVLCDTKASDIIKKRPDGILLSNGPGDPADNESIIDEIKKIMDSTIDGKRIPLFGICLGHQLMALAAGGRTTKLKYGHRGANHSVLDTQTHRVYITSQNHGFAVDCSSLPCGAFSRFINTNDGTNEGIVYSDRPFFSVQFHPEAAAGPLDTGFLFDEFVKLINR